MGFSDLNAGSLHDDIKKKTIELFGSAVPWWSSWTTAIPVGNPEEITYHEAHAFGLTGFAPQVETPTNQDTTSVTASLTATVKECKMFVTNKDMRDNPRTVQRFAAQMVDLAMEAAGASIASTLFTLDTTAHPLNGSAYIAAQGGGTLYAADAYTLTHLDGTTTNQSNVSTTAYSRSAVRANAQTRWKYLNFGKRRTVNYNVPAVILAPIDLSLTTDEVRGLTAVTDSGGTLEVPVTSRIERVIENPHFSTADANDWWSIYPCEMEDLDGVRRLAGPIRPWFRFLPVTRVTQADDANGWHLLGEIEYGIWTSLTVHNSCIMNKVA